MVRVVTLKYEAVHGHKPRQPQGHSIWSWAFQIDMAPTLVQRGRNNDSFRHRAVSVRRSI